ncbi:MAG: hypothetical protein WB611_03855 [Stellaceae bacterium]
MNNPFALSNLTDCVALLIGRLIMAWGLFDQRLYSQIILFESEKYMSNPKGDAPTIEQIIDYSFEKRTRKLRRLALELSISDKNTMKKVDDIIRRLTELSQIRHHLAHGYVRIGSAPGQPLAVEIISHRERWEGQRILTRKILKDGYKPKAEDLRSSYTFEQLNDAKVKLDCLYDEFSEVFGEIRLLSAKRRQADQLAPE